MELFKNKKIKIKSKSIQKKSRPQKNIKTKIQKRHKKYGGTLSFFHFLFFKKYKHTFLFFIHNKSDNKKTHSLKKITKKSYPKIGCKVSIVLIRKKFLF